MMETYEFLFYFLIMGIGLYAICKEIFRGFYWLGVHALAPLLIWFTTTITFQYYWLPVIRWLLNKASLWFFAKEYRVEMVATNGTMITVGGLPAISASEKFDCLVKEGGWERVRMYKIDKKGDEHTIRRISW